MTGPTLRLATPADAAPLAALKLATFRQSFVDGGFAIPYPPDDLQRFVDATYTPAKVAAELADPTHTNWLVEDGGAMIAYAHVGPCKLPHPQATLAQGELYQIYVLDGAQGLGLGRRLLDTALDHLAATRPGPIWLGVWSGNHRAQAIYAARGFAKVGEYRFPVGNWEDDEFIFRRD